MVIVAALKPISGKICSRCPKGKIYHGYRIEYGQTRRLADRIGIWRHIGAL